MFWCEESVVPPSSRGRRPLLIFLHLIYLLSLPDVLPVLFFFFFFFSSAGNLTVNSAGQMNGSVTQVNIIDHTISRIETNKPAAADTNEQL